MTLLDMGRVAIEDLPKGNAVAAQVEALQGGLARDADGILRRDGGSPRRPGAPGAALRVRGVGLALGRARLGGGRGVAGAGVDENC